MRLKFLNKTNPFSFFFFPFSLKKVFPITLTIFFLFSFFIFPFSCKESTSTQTVTFSGTVTLQDTSDNSGVEVMLFKPLDFSGEGRMPAVDTALINLNKNYPGVGIEVNQQTEFYWREQEPAYKTTTDAQGNWKITNVEPGSYHIVARKKGYGWRVLYDANEKSEKRLTLKKAIIWRGTYNAPVVVPENSFVEVVDNAIFKSDVTLNAGTIVEFLNSSSIETRHSINVEIYGNVSINGTQEEPVYIWADDSVNNDNLRVFSAKDVEIKRLVMRDVKNGIYLGQPSLAAIQGSYFANEREALNITDCDSAVIKNCVFHKMTENGVSTFNSHVRFQQNICYACENSGINSKNARNSLIKYNVFKACDNYGVALNLGGNIYQNSFMLLLYNDFAQNKNHIFLGKNSYGYFNKNNFFKSDLFYIKTVLRGKADTINFQGNYWNTVNKLEIAKKIYDIRSVGNGSKKTGPIIDFNYFKMEKIIWPGL